MDVADMFSLINDHGFTDTASTRKLTELNDALYDAASREAWPHLETSINLTFTGSSATADNAPTNLGQVMDVVDLSTKQPVEWTRLDVFDKQGLDLAQTGSPAQYYYLLGDTVNFWPVPPASASIRMRYYRVPTALTESTVSANVDWPLNHHRILVLGALYRLYDLEDDPEQAIRFQQHYEQRLQQAMVDQLSRQSDRPDRIYMDPWFDYDPFD